MENIKMNNIKYMPDYKFYRLLVPKVLSTEDIKFLFNAGTIWAKDEKNKVLGSPINYLNDVSGSNDDEPKIVSIAFEENDKDFESVSYKDYWSWFHDEYLSNREFFIGIGFTIEELQDWSENHKWFISEGE